jgi:tetratricopeptide (TPR) repeat protein
MNRTCEIFKSPALTALLTVLLALSAAVQPANANRRNAGNGVEAANSANTASRHQGLDKRFTAEQLREMAVTARESGDTPYLTAILQALTVLEPRRFDVRLEVGGIYAAQNNFGEAIRALNEAMEIIPSDEAPHRLLAQIYRKMGNDSLHGHHLSRAAFLAQRNWENQYNLAMYHLSRGNMMHAEQLLARTVELNGDFAQAKFEYAGIMLEKGDAETAFRMYDGARLAEPGNARYMAFSAYAALLSGRVNVSAENLSAAQARAPHNSAVLYVTGLIHRHNGNLAAAETSIREALRYSPDDAAALEALGDILVANFKFGEACGNYLRAWQTAGYSERLVYKLGKALVADGKFAEAKDFFEAIAARNPGNGELLYRLTDVYCELGNIRQATATLARFNRELSLGWLQTAQGRVYEAQGEVNFARTAYGAAMMINPQNPHAAAGLGRISMTQADWDAAIAHFETAIAHDPGNPRLLLSKAKALEGKGSIREAVAAYETAIARNPRNTAAYLSVAALMERQGTLIEAIKYLNRGLEANPNDAGLLQHLGKVYLATKQYERAIAAYQASIGRRVNAQSVETLLIIGNIYYQELTDERQAREFFRRYVRAGGKESREVAQLMRHMNRNRTRT